VDGDSDLDLIAANGTPFSGPGQNVLFLNDGAGFFADVTSTKMPSSVAATRSIAIGDVDGDGDPDLIVGNEPYHVNHVGYVAGEDFLYLNDGTGTFTDATSSRLPQYRDRTRAVVLVDVDRDGDLDVVAGNFGEQSRLYLNDGRGTFSEATTSHLPARVLGTSAVAAGDVDGDGDADLVLGNDGQESLYLNDGGGRYGDATAGRMPPDLELTWVVVLVDVDLDGDLDVVTGNDSGRNKLYLNDGRGRFSDGTANRLPVVFDDRTVAIAAGDVDGDGDPDLVLANWKSDGLYLNDGNGTFTDVTASRLPQIPGTLGAAVALGDVDRDLDLDLLLGTSSPGGFLMNLHRQVYAPRPPWRDSDYVLRFTAMRW
jgi:hypothetical protein